MVTLTKWTRENVRKSCCYWLVSSSNSNTCIIMTKAKLRGWRRRRLNTWITVILEMYTIRPAWNHRVQEERERQSFHQSVCNLIFILPSFFPSSSFSPSRQPVFETVTVDVTKREGGFSHSPLLFLSWNFSSLVSPCLVMNDCITQQDYNEKKSNEKADFPGLFCQEWLEMTVTSESLVMFVIVMYSLPSLWHQELSLCLQLFSESTASFYFQSLKVLPSCILTRSWEFRSIVSQ